MNGRLRGLLAVLLLAGLFNPMSSAPAEAAEVVGDGTPESCTEAAFDAALAPGGLVTFNCGPANHTITLTNQKTLTDDVEIKGGGLITLDGANSSRLFNVSFGPTLELRNITLANGSGPGGAVLVGSVSTLRAIDTTFVSNSSSSGGGAIDNNGGDVEVMNSTFSGNSAEDGGAILNDGAMLITASTFTGNSTVSSGGAIYNTGTLVLTATTISGNSSGINGGGVRNVNGAIIIASSIVALNTAPETAHQNCSNNGGTIVSSGSNLSNDASCPFTDTGDIRDSANVDLGPLQDNGGPTQTMAPASTSAAINVADCTLSTTEDQRGVARPTSGTSCDIGAVEVRGPDVFAPFVFPSPSDEGQSINLSTMFFPTPGGEGPYTCTIDYGDGTDPEPGLVIDDSLCDGLGHVYVDDDPSGTPSDDYTITVTVYDSTGSGSASTFHTVFNVAPMITAITTDGPVPQGLPVTITVTATDAGVNDTLTYSFDCDNDGSYETPGAGNRGQCALDPGAATSTVGVKVEDDDLGVTTGTVVVGQTLTLCLNYSTGAVSEPGMSGCSAGTIALTMPGITPVTFCINPYTGRLTWAARGTCAGSYWPHMVPDDGPLHYCRSLWTGQLREPSTPGQCNAYETPGVIPG